MKKSTLALLVAAQFGLLACSSNPTANLGVNAQRVAVSNFDRDGIRLAYTLDGKLTSVESIVYTPIFGTDPSATESAQKRSEKISKVQLKNFIDKKTLTGTLSASIISINLEHASLQQKSGITDSQNLVASDREVFLDKSGKDVNASSESSKVLDDATKLAQLLDKNTDWRDVDGGMALSSSKPVNNGQTLEVIYRWTAKPKN
ncbi:hypothetical protein [Polynucleobacter sp. AP-Kolm-20A-A1]|uniref:hypothetical protein n=1 Tax=Polynucleobacter sp. AP-Kolm-20A-A1 TaxID=2081041 RepID=UPI001BFE15B9|nr:hypothetical protein [Polynucleobacter sp. AP-Kolm-20A-A1]QWE21253.1 hypothetical protein C2745_03465 [Polynucleobacter sp. AP-Kolm-20A-A1]